VPPSRAHAAPELIPIIVNATPEHAFEVFTAWLVSARLPNGVCV